MVHGDCFAWEINNSCGSYALSLTGGIDEEPIMFAEEFAADNCGVCGQMAQTLFPRRPGSAEVEGQGPYSGTLEHYRPECQVHQCVLVAD